MSPDLCFGLLAVSFLFFAFALLCGRLLLTLRIVGLLALWRLAALLAAFSLLWLFGNRLYPFRDRGRRLGKNILREVIQERHACGGYPAPGLVVRDKPRDFKLLEGLSDNRAAALPESIRS